MASCNLYHCCHWLEFLHDDVIKWKLFPRYWPFVRGIHRSPVNSPHKGQWRGTLMFSLIRAWAYDWTNNWHSGDLRSHWFTVVNCRYCNNDIALRTCCSVNIAIVLRCMIALNANRGLPKWTCYNVPDSGRYRPCTASIGSGTIKAKLW